MKTQEVVKGCVDYFNAKVINELGPVLAIFKGFRLANPDYATLLLFPSVQYDIFKNDLLPLVAKGIVTEEQRDMLVAELGRYKNALSTYQPSAVDATIADKHSNYMSFWTAVRDLPEWSKFASHSLLYVPSSSAAERAFSMLKYIYGDRQVRSLEDRVETACMLRFNNRS